MTDLDKAVALLQGNTTCVAVKGNRIYRSEKTGIAPMLSFAEEGKDLHGFSVADKIVGKAAALLFVGAGVSAVYAEVLSQNGKRILEKYGIPFSYRSLTEAIINRTGTGICPMEQAVAETDDPKSAKELILFTVKQLKNMT